MGICDDLINLYIVKKADIPIFSSTYCRIRSIFVRRSHCFRQATSNNNCKGERAIDDKVIVSIDSNKLIVSLVVDSLVILEVDCLVRDPLKNRL